MFREVEEKRKELINRYRIKKADLTILKPIDPGNLVRKPFWKNMSLVEKIRQMVPKLREPRKVNKIKSMTAELENGLSPEKKLAVLSTMAQFLIEFPEYGKDYDRKVEEALKFVISDPKHEIRFNDETGMFGGHDIEKSFHQTNERSVHQTNKLISFLEYYNELKKIDKEEADFFIEDVENWLKRNAGLEHDFEFEPSGKPQDPNMIMRALSRITLDRLKSLFDEHMDDLKKPDKSEFFEFGDSTHAKDYKQGPKTERSSHI